MTQKGHTNQKTKDSSSPSPEQLSKTLFKDDLREIDIGLIDTYSKIENEGTISF